MYANDFDLAVGEVINTTANSLAQALTGPPPKRYDLAMSGFGGLFGRLFEPLMKRRAIRRYLTLLPPRLVADYGHAAPYTPAQVESTIRRYKITSERFSAYALVIFCDKAEIPHILDKYKIPNDSRFELGAYYSQGAAFSFHSGSNAEGSHGLSDGGHDAGSGGGHH